MNDHETTVDKTVTDRIMVNCKCGAKWSQPLNSTPEHMQSILDSHIAYFNKPAMKVD